jgi:hypothetical protein
MKRLATLLVAAMMLMSLSGLALAEEAKPEENKATGEATPEKKVKKAKKAKKDEAAETKKDEAPAKAAKPAKKKKEAAGC